jgi:hypothetical protein
MYEEFEDTKGAISRRINNAIVKIKNKTKGQKIIHKTLHSIQKFEKHEPH